MVCNHSSEDSSYKGSDSYRDVNIENYIDSFKEISKLGGHIIRMGSSEQKKLDLKIQNLIDYPHSGFKSDIMDLFYGQNCKFF